MLAIHSQGDLRDFHQYLHRCLVRCRFVPWYVADSHAVRHNLVPGQEKRLPSHEESHLGGALESLPRKYLGSAAGRHHYRRYLQRGVLPPRKRRP